MSFPKLPLLVGTLAMTTGAAYAQNASTSGAPVQSYTTVDANGNLVRVSVRNPALQSNGIAQKRESGGVTSSDRTRRWREGDRNDNVRRGTTYYVPAVPYYPYPYAAPTYNNYYYPEQPTTTVVSPPHFSWSHPPTITSIPLGTTYYGGYPAPAYPNYPAPAYGYPAPAYGYPAAPTYGYPAPAYGYPAYGYPTYPAYGTSTTIIGAGTGSIYSQSQTGGYGFSLGSGGFSVQLGNQRSSTSTTVTGY